MPNVNNCKIEQCICGAAPICQLQAVGPVYVDYSITQHVSCPNCQITVSGEKGIKLWNMLMRCSRRTKRINAKQKMSKKATKEQ